MGIDFRGLKEYYYFSALRGIFKYFYFKSYVKNNRLPQRNKG